MKLYLDTLKEFTSQFGFFAITRGDYESLPSPMVAIAMSDGQMQDIVNEIEASMMQDYDEKDFELLANFRSEDCSYMTLEQQKFADDMSIRECGYFETCAYNAGMQYYEDLSDEEYNELVRKKAKG